MTLDCAESAAHATHLIVTREPFVLSRFGDGDLYCMKADTEAEAAEMLAATLGPRNGRPPLALADGEQWSEALAYSLREAWDAITNYDGPLLLGDPTTSGFGPELYPYWQTLAARITRPYTAVHHEMFWLRDEPQPELLGLLRAIRDSPYHKALVGRSELEAAAKMIGADFLEVDPFDSLQDALRISWLARQHLRGYDMVLLCAGRGGKEMTRLMLGRVPWIIDVGSLFDPLFIGPSRPRAGAASDEDAEAFFSALMGEPVRVAVGRPGRAYG